MKKLYKLVTLLLTLTISTSLMAVDYYVDPLGTDDGAHGSSPGTGAWATIEYAVNHVADPATATIVINVAAGTYNLWDGSNTNSIDISITFLDLTIQGAGEVSTIVQGNTSAASANSYIFSIYAPETGTSDVTLKDMTIRYGNSTWAAGCGISNYEETLTLTNCTISGNLTTSSGGGIYNKNGSLTMNNCTVSGNAADYGGGGIFNYNSGILMMTNCTVSGNTTGSGGSGGGIYQYSGTGRTTTITMTNCTISGNESVWAGGGIANDNYGTAATITMTNCTVSGNDATDASGLGGGFYLDNGTLIIKNTIIANNTHGAVNDDYYYYAGTLTDNGYNIVEYSNVAANATGGFNSASDILYNTIYNSGTTTATSWTKNAVAVSGSLNLSSTLANNGGPTQTLAISSGSFAMESGVWDASVTTDQRGEPRHSSPTIGAYEPSYSQSWTGSTSSDWNTAANWQPSVLPVSQDDITIPDVANDPVIDTYTNAVCNTLTVEPGATFTVIGNLVVGN
jgi:hypothetical protein